MTSYPPITCDYDQQEAAEALSRLERVREAVATAIDEARAAATLLTEPRMAEAIEALTDLLTDAASDAALERHITALDRALALYAEAGFSAGANGRRFRAPE
jgi:hypothetical protein